MSEFESFGFLAWFGWGSILTAEAYRCVGEFDRAATFVARGLDVATKVGYWYGVGFGERVIGRIARDRGRHEEAAAAFTKSLHTFDRIGARFEAERARRECKETT